MGEARVVIVTGPACRDEEVARLAEAGDVVVVWSADADLCGRLVAAAVEAGGRAASFVAGDGAGAEAALRTFVAEHFGGLDVVVERGAAG